LKLWPESSCDRNTEIGLQMQLPKFVVGKPNAPQVLPVQLPFTIVDTPPQTHVPPVNPPGQYVAVALPLHEPLTYVPAGPHDRYWHAGP
jgi:hypothetical protein